MKKLMLLSAILGVTGIVVLNSGEVSAATYDGNNKSKNTNKVTILDGKPEIVNPVDPSKPIEPVKPVNPSNGDLVLQYVSDFDFGQQEKSANGFKVNALPDTVKLDGNEVDVPSFISTKDLRTEREKGWTLTVKASPFKNKDDKVIDGATVILSNATYNDNSADSKPTINASASSALVEEGLKLLPNTEYKVSSADSAVPKQGVGTYSLSLGTVEKGRVTGVTFDMPRNTAVDSDSYSATFEWELNSIANI